MQAHLLPLFPLRVLVFPRTRLPLHIFEERYKEMVGEAIRDRTEFGIVLAADQGILNTGCTVMVDEVLDKYPDGRMDIVTNGVRRFEVTALNQEKSYLRGEVSFFDDDEPGPAPFEIREKALEIYQRWLQLDASQAAVEVLLTDPQLSFQLAQRIPDLDFLQSLLRDRSEASRLLKVAEFLNSYIPKQQLTAAIKKVAPLNGHGHKPPAV
ncbi:MAG: LON peptidase substrate-binding domain-containing protein [Bryobacteraceae bacterium]